MKCRSKDSASLVDLDKNNKLYKRLLATFGLLLTHTWFSVMILYDSQILSPQTSPKIFKYYPYVAYPSVIFGFVIFVFYKNHFFLSELDKKYTPLWIKLQVSFLEC